MKKMLSVILCICLIFVSSTVGISAVAVTFLNRYLANILTGNLAVLKDLIYAVILIAIVVYTNAPALKSFREKYNFKLLASKLKFKSADKKNAPVITEKEEN